MPRTLFSFRGLILVFGLVAVGLPLALVWQLGIVRALNTLNQDIALTRQGQFAAAAVLQYQLDEETGVRGYAATHRPTFLGPYERGSSTMPERLAELQQILGDVYDVYSIDPDRTLLIVGDVSGKGLAAAVDTTFVRYALRALAGEGLAPDEIVRRFDALYHAANPTPESFVSLVAAVYDRRDGSLAYTNAGHEGAWVRRGIDVERLPPTGPIVGIGGLPFEAGRTTLGPGEFLILATDGLTEARDSRGQIVPADRGPRLDRGRRRALAAEPRRRLGRFRDALHARADRRRPGDSRRPAAAVTLHRER